MNVQQVGTVRSRLALGALALATLVIGLDTTVLTIALPTLAVDLRANTAALQWFTTAYTLALAALLLPAGVLGDRFGRKKFLLGAQVLFGVASACCAFASSTGELIAARVLLGVAAAVLMPLGMAVLPTLFPDARERSRAMTIWVTAMGLGMPLGPLIGGWLLNHFWWGSVFLINVPFVVVGVVAVAVLVPESRSVSVFTVDRIGVLSVGVGLVGVTYGFIRIGERGWGDRPAWVLIAAAGVVLAGFVMWQRALTARARHPLIDLALFRNGGFAWGVVALTLGNFALFGMFFAAPQYFQGVLGADALGSGLRLLPMIGGVVVGARVVDRLVRKTGPRSAILVGFAFFVLGLVLGALTEVESGYGYVAGWLAALGLGMGLVMPAAMGMAMNSLVVERAGTGSALLQAVRQAGGTIGVAILGTVSATRYHDRLGELDRDPIRDSVNAGVAVAHRLGDAAMVLQVQSAFVAGMSLMLWVCAAISAGALVLLAIFLPRARGVFEPQPNAAESTHAA